jgi:hypothetical protein
MAQQGIVRHLPGRPWFAALKPRIRRRTAHSQPPRRFPAWVGIFLSTPGLGASLWPGWRSAARLLYRRTGRYPRAHVPIFRRLTIGPPGYGPGRCEQARPHEASSNNRSWPQVIPVLSRLRTQSAVLRPEPQAGIGEESDLLAAWVSIPTVIAPSRPRSLCDSTALTASARIVVSRARALSRWPPMIVDAVVRRVATPSSARRRRNWSCLSPSAAPGNTTVRFLSTAISTDVG